MAEPRELEKKGAGNLLLRIGLSGNFILWTYERLMRTKDRVRLAYAHLRGRRRTIVQMNDDPGDRYALVAGFGSKSLPKSLEQIIPALKERGLNVVLCHNGRLSPEAQARLKPYLHAMIFRPNIGRDFGAYQDGIRYLQSKKTPPKRVLFINDSIFFLPKGLNKLIADLDTDEHPYVGCTENFQFHYHVGSFLFSIGREVFESAAFRAFWKQYFPFSTRKYSINCGEVRLTKYIKDKGGFVPHILYSMHEAGKYVHEWTMEDLEENLYLLPRYARIMIYERVLHKTYVDPVAVSLDGRNGGDYRAATVSDELDAARDISLKSLLVTLVRSFEGGSQAHLGCGVFVKYLGMPIIKKDVAYRDVYNATDVFKMMQEHGYPDMDDVHSEIRRRGYPIVFGRFRMLLYSAGFI